MTRLIRIAVLVVSCALAASVQAQPTTPKEEAPPPDCGALESAGSSERLLAAGRCYEAAGKRASAVAAYKKAEAQAKVENAAARAKQAGEAAAALEARVSRITIQPSLPAAGLTILLDGRAVPAGGASLPVDGGTHRVEASAPGRRPWSTEVVVRPEGDNQTVSVPELEAEAAVAPSPAPTDEAAAPAPAPTAPPEEDGMSDRQIAGITLLVLGGAAVIVGAVLGGVALKKGSDAEEQCPGKVCPPGVSAAGVQSDIRPFAEASTMTLVMGGAAAVLGISLLVVDAVCGPDVTVAAGPFGLDIAGRF